MDTKLKGKVAIVTGAARDVGREIARGRGWGVVLWTTLGRVPDLTEWMPDIWAYRRSVAWMPGSAGVAARSGSMIWGGVALRNSRPRCVR